MMASRSVTEDVDQRAQALLARFATLLSRLDRLERHIALGDTSLNRKQSSGGSAHNEVQHKGIIHSPDAASASPEHSAEASLAAALVDASPVQVKLAQELAGRQFTEFRFVRAPPEYYDQPLEFRRNILKAHSIDHLCKSIIMENTRADPSVGWSNPKYSKYYVVIVQYTARLNAEKLKSHLYKLNAGAISNKQFNMRLAPEDVSDALSGFEHNAVSPIAIKTRLPIVLSHQIAALQPDLFWLGAGEVDLKVGVRAAEFIARYEPMIVDCT